jgi:oligopeptide/dipeptide ABC transporter ATP-binding protein
VATLESGLALPATVGEPILSVHDLRVSFQVRGGEVEVVRGVSFELRRGETLAVVGESGSGKTLTALALLGLIPGRNVKVTGDVRYRGINLVGAGEATLASLRGRDFGVVSQDPMTSLNPVMPIGAQIAEAIRIHRRSVRRAEARRLAVSLLEEVGMPEPERRGQQYPHELSGGMRQRAVLAMAVANRPPVLIADEPTTALDVTIQAQIMDVFRRVQSESGGSTILITHDLALVSEVADRVLVFYGGRVVESGPVDEVLAASRHPYTIGLLGCVPEVGSRRRLQQLPGEVPEPGHFPPGCSFAPRCELGRDREPCLGSPPELRAAGTAGHESACHYLEELVTGPEAARPGGAA